MVGELLFEGSLLRADVVFVGAAFSIEAGVQVRCHFEKIENNDVFRQEVVEFERQLLAFFRCEMRFRVKMGVVGAGMHAGVGAPATGDGHARFTQQQRETVLQRLLHRRMVRLNLPAEKCRSIIC